MHELNNKLIGLMAIRVLVILSIFLPVLLFAPAALAGEQSWLQLFFGPLDATAGLDVPDAKRQVLRMLVALVSIQTLLYATLLRVLRHRADLHAVIQLLGDLLVISFLIYRFGGLTANLSILYFVIIAVASFLLRRRGAIGVAITASILYSTVLFVQRSSAIRALWPSPSVAGIEAVDPDAAATDATPAAMAAGRWSWLAPPPIEDLSGVPIGYNLFIHYLGFVSVAVFTSYLSRDPLLEAELRQRSSALAYLKVLHRDVIQSISSGLISTDLDGVVTDVNRAAEGILDVRAAEAEGLSITMLDMFEENEWRRWTLASELGMVRDELERERGGQPLFLGFSLTPLRDGDGVHRGYIIIFQNLTEQRRLREQVRLQDRMAAVGQMAAGLAHEVGNPLTAISGSVQMLANAADADGRQKKLLEITLRESQRLDRTVKSFLHFATPRERALRRFDLASLLSEDAELLRNSEDVLDSHQIDVDIDPRTLDVVADRDQIGQLFWNLARNALQAMPDGGKLTIVGRALPEGRYRLEFRDTGHGMTSEERENLFHPFQSFFDGGHGLGMAIVYRIVEEHRGDIAVDSRLGRGTTISVSMPLDATLTEHTA